MGYMLLGGAGAWGSLFISSSYSTSVTSVQWRVSGKEPGSSLSIANSEIRGCCLVGGFLSFLVQENIHSS